MPRWDNFKWKNPHTELHKQPNKWCTPKAIVNKRIAAVAQMLIWGYPSWRIYQFGEENRQLSASQMSEYISRATKLNSTIDYDNIEEQRALTLKQTDEVIQNYAIEKNWAGVLAGWKRKWEILGFEASKKIDLSQKINIDDIINVGAERIRAKFLNKTWRTNDWRW